MSTMILAVDPAKSPFAPGYPRRGRSAGGTGHAIQSAALPTQALPGTREKVAILAQRARLGLGLWHPDDARPDQPAAARAAV